MPSTPTKPPVPAIASVIYEPSPNQLSANNENMTPLNDDIIINMMKSRKFFVPPVL